MPVVNGQMMTVINVMATSLDGKIAQYPQQADRERVHNGFSSREDRALLRDQLEIADAVIMSGASLRASGKMLARKNRRGRFPVVVVFSNSPHSLRDILISEEEVEKILVSRDPVHGAEAIGNVEKISYKEAPPANFVLSYLSSREDMENIVLFGGGAINRIFYKEGMVDELKITISPFIFGGVDASNFVDPGLPNLIHFCLKSSQIAGDHVFLTYMVKAN